MRFTTAEREEGLSGRAGGEEDELEEVVVWGFAVEVEDAPVAVSINSQHLITSGRIVGYGEGAHQDTYQLRLPFPRAWAAIPLPC